MIRILLLISSLFLLTGMSTGKINDKPRDGDYICWAAPPKEALKKCRPRCSGVGVYAWSLKERYAQELALKLCDTEYETDMCVIEYCEKYYEDKQ